MIAKLKAAYARLTATKGGAIANRVVIIAVGAFVAKFGTEEIAEHLLEAPNYLNLSLWHQVISASLTAAEGAVLTFVQSALWTIIGGGPQLRRSNRVGFKIRRASRG